MLLSTGVGHDRDSLVSGVVTSGPGPFVWVCGCGGWRVCIYKKYSGSGSGRGRCDVIISKSSAQYLLSTRYQILIPQFALWPPCLSLFIESAPYKPRSGVVCGVSPPLATSSLSWTAAPFAPSRNAFSRKPKKKNQEHFFRDGEGTCTDQNTSTRTSPKHRKFRGKSKLPHLELSSALYAASLVVALLL